MPQRLRHLLSACQRSAPSCPSPAQHEASHPPGQHTGLGHFVMLRWNQVCPNDPSFREQLGTPTEKKESNWNYSITHWLKSPGLIGHYLL